MTSVGPERLALVLLEVLEVADLHDAVAGHDPEDREEPDERAERDDAVAEEVGGQHAADERHRQREERERRQAPAAERRQQEEEDADGGEDAVEEQPAVGLLPLLVLPGHLGVVADRELHLLEPVLDVLGDRAEVATLHVGADLDGPRHVLAVDRVRAGA